MQTKVEDNSRDNLKIQENVIYLKQQKAELEIRSGT